MGKETINEQITFVQNDLILRYADNDFNYFFNGGHNSYYIIIVCFSGKVEIKYKDKIYIMRNGDVFLAGKRENFLVNYGGEPTEFLEIRFSEIFFHKLDKEYDLINPFYNKDVMKIMNFKDKSQEFISAINSVKKALLHRKPRAFVLSSLSLLLCEINYEFEESAYQISNLGTTNYTKIANYVDNHIFEKITIQSVADAVFLSPRCITNTVKRICGLSFHQWITEKRLVDAKYAVSAGHHSLTEIASIYGFETYSTFYRAFIKKFGMTPKEFREKYHR